jgi:hypothetical protein
MANVMATYISSDSGCIISENTRQQLASCRVSMARKSRRRNSGLFILFLLVVISFGIAIWSGVNLSTVIIVMVSLAILAMIVSIARRQGRRGISSGNVKAVRRKRSIGYKQQRGITLGLVVLGILALLVLMATPTINWFRQNLHTMSSLITNWFGQNLHTIITTVLLLVALTVVGTFVWINRQRIIPRRIGTGVGEYLNDFSRPPRSMKDQSLASEVWQKIVDFRCKGHYEKERDFQYELHRQLEAEFPGKVKWEHKKGMSRADISIDRIAIEIKGPTRNSQLREAIRQIGTYGNDYDFIFFILFKPQWNESYFDRFIKALSRFSHVGVITNSG